MLHSCGMCYDYKIGQENEPLPFLPVDSLTSPWRSLSKVVGRGTGNDYRIGQEMDPSPKHTQTASSCAVVGEWGKQSWGSFFAMIAVSCLPRELLRYGGKVAENMTITAASIAIQSCQ